MPFETACVVVPESVPPLPASVPPFTAMLTVTLPTKVVTRFPKASSTSTWTGGAIAAPALAFDGSTMNETCEAAAALMVKVLLVAPANVGAVTESRYPVPFLSIERPGNDAMPPAAVTVLVPDSVAPDVPVPPVMAIVTLPLKPVSRLFAASRAASVIVGMARPAVVVVGCDVKTRWLDVLAVMSNAVLVAPVIVDVAASVWFVCARLMLRLLNVASPATAAFDVVPDRTPPDAFASAIATVTFPVKRVATFPNASRAVTSTCGAIGDRAVALDGWTVNTR